MARPSLVEQTFSPASTLPSAKVKFTVPEYNSLFAPWPKPWDRIYSTESLHHQHTLANPQYNLLYQFPRPGPWSNNPELPRWVATLVPRAIFHFIYNISSITLNSIYKYRRRNRYDWHLLRLYSFSASIYISIALGHIGSKKIRQLDKNAIIGMDIFSNYLPSPDVKRKDKIHLGKLSPEKSTIIKEYISTKR